MKRILSLALATVLSISMLAGCSPKSDDQGTDGETPAALTELYTTAINSARDEEMNNIVPVINEGESDDAAYILSLISLTPEDMTAYALAISPMNIKAYGIAVIRPAAGKEETVKTALQTFIDTQKANFETYLADQYEIANAAHLETLEDGTIIMVMCEDHEQVFNSIKASLEQG